VVDSCAIPLLVLCVQVGTSKTPKRQDFQG
jgi:hypothetical protein